MKLIFPHFTGFCDTKDLARATRWRKNQLLALGKFMDADEVELMNTDKGEIWFINKGDKRLTLTIKNNPSGAWMEVLVTKDMNVKMRRHKNAKQR
jgi:hypothetical protein